MTLSFGAGTTLNARPHPRVAVVSWQSQLREQWAAVLRSLVATVDEFQSTSEADWSEYDCVFTDQNPLCFETRNLAGHYEPDRYEVRWSQNFAAHLDVFVLLGLPGDSASGQFIGAWPECSQGGEWSADWPHFLLTMAGRTKGSYVTRVEGLSESLSRAVDQTIAAVAKKRSDHLVYEVLPAIDIGPDVEESTTRPLLLGPSNVPLAMTWTRESGATVWAVPADTVDVMILVREAFVEWNLRDPKRYPSIPDWDHDVRYRTAAERSLHVEPDSVEDEFEQVKTSHEAEVVRLLERLDEVERTDGDARRALLRADGNTLERAVKSALEDLGFAVQPMDEVNLVSKREDLRVTDPDVDGRIAICEVKGYTRGLAWTLCARLNTMRACLRVTKASCRRSGSS